MLVWYLCDERVPARDELSKGPRGEHWVRPSGVVHKQQLKGFRVALDAKLHQPPELGAVELHVPRLWGYRVA